MWRRHDKEKGATLILVLTSVLMIIVFTLATVYRGQILRSRIALQTAADATVTSGALWQARSLNLIAGMNQGMLVFLSAALVAAIILAGLMACSATIVGAYGCGLVLEEIGPTLEDTITNSWETAVQLAKMERYVQKLGPPLVLGNVAYAAVKNKVSLAVPFPMIPETSDKSHDLPFVLSLHLKDGEFSALFAEALKTIGKDVPPEYIKYAAEALKLIHWLLKKADEDPNPLVLDDDFRPRMKLGLLAYQKLPHETLGLLTLSQATPFLAGARFGEENLFDMKWHVKLEPVDFISDFLKAESTGKAVDEN